MKLMKKTILVFLLLLTMTSCSDKEEIVEIEKKDFFIEIKNFNDFWSEVLITKVWKLNSSQNVEIKSNAVWRVKYINVKEWDSVYKWQILANIEDNIWSYTINLEKAKNSLEKARLNYDIQESQLNKVISDLNINLKDTMVDEIWSSSSLQLQKLEESIEKMTIDLDKLKASNIQTLKWFKISLEKEYDRFELYNDDVIDFADNLLWVTLFNRNENDNFENFLWAKDTAQKSQSETLLREIIKYKDLNTNNFDFNNLKTDDFSNILSELKSWYNKIDNLLSSIEITLDNSIPSSWSLTFTEISTYKTSVNTYQSTSTVNNWYYISLKNSINSFLDTYKNSEASLAKQLSLLHSDKKIYINSLDVKLELDENALTEKKLNKDLTLKNLDRLIVDAEIAYREALKEYQKLTIKSPISWIIWNINITKWEEIWVWINLFSISNKKDKEIEVSFNYEELKNIIKWSSAYIDYNNTTITWSIYSISNIADENLNYKARISFDNNINVIWDVVSVSIPMKSNYKLLPLDILKIRDLNIWTINIYKDWKIEHIDIKLWKIYWKKIETYDVLWDDFQIITSYVDNYTPDKFELKIK